jgi:uncharacterized protein YlxP (DUF503 family)
MTFVIRGSHSLKDKRRIIKSFKERARKKFNVSIAEVGSLDSWQQCDFGIAFVANDSKFINSVLSKVVNFSRFFTEMELIDYQIEVL